MPSQLPTDLAKVLEQLGGVHYAFAPHRANLWAARIIGPFCALAGGTIIVLGLMSSRVPREKLPGLIGLGLVLVGSGTAAFVWSFLRSTYRAFVCRDGLAVLAFGKIRSFRWEDVVQVQAISRSGKQVWTISYVPGAVLEINEESVARVQRLMELIYAEVERHQIR